MLHDAELNFTPSTTIPADGWIPTRLPANALSKRATPNADGVINAWARLSFDEPQFDNRALALYTENNREGVTIFLNGNEIFRNGPDDNARIMGWNRPYLVSLPESLIKKKRNEIVVRVRSGENLGLSIGAIEIGPRYILERHYNFQNNVRIFGPLVANYIMLFLTVAVIMLWLARRSEPTLLWIALTGGLWFVRNFHFFAYQSPIDSLIFM